MIRTSLHQRTALPMACVLGCLLATAGGGSGASAGEASSVADDVAMVRPFIGETTALVLKVDPRGLSLPDLAVTLESVVPASGQAYRAWATEVADGLRTLRAAASGQAVYATVGLPLSMTQWPVALFLKETPDVDRKQLLGCTKVFNPMECWARDGLIVAMPWRGAHGAAALDAWVLSPREGLADAFEAVRGYPIQVLLLPPDYIRRTVTELMPQLPRQLGGGPSDVLTEGLVWAALGVDLAQLRAELVVQSRSEEAARGLVEHLPKMLRGAYDGLSEIKTPRSRETFEVLRSVVEPQLDGDRFTVRLAGPESTGGSLRLVTAAAAAVRGTIYRRTHTDSFKQILLAMHNHHNAYKVFPPRDEVRDESGKSSLSWRVHILPYLDEEELYREFHLDEPWDGPHNKELIEKMPDVYGSHWWGLAPGHTTFLAPAGEDTIIGGPKATAFRNVTDGTSATVVLVEVKPGLAVPWTAPKDYAFDPASPGRGLQVGGDGRFLTGLAEGSAGLIRGNIEPELLLRLFRKSDGQRIDWNLVR